MPPTGDEFSGPLSIYQAILIAKGCLLLLLIDPEPEVMEQFQSLKKPVILVFSAGLPLLCKEILKRLAAAPTARFKGTCYKVVVGIYCQG